MEVDVGEELRNMIDQMAMTRLEFESSKGHRKLKQLFKLPIEDFKAIREDLIELTVG